LQQAGYSVQQCANLQQARNAYFHRQPTLAVIDSDLPDGDGLDLCNWIYSQRQSLILILSARNGENDIVKGLKAGADDYLTKPFGMQEFMARVETLTRRLRMSSAPLRQTPTAKPSSASPQRSQVRACSAFTARMVMRD
jgi:two-component system OmpR family response regulator